MVYIKANAEILKVYQRVITSMKERVEWNGEIIIRKNTMILVGRVRSMYFELSSRRVYSDIEEFSLDSAKAFEMENNKLLTNIINMMLYPFGKWGAIKGLNVEQDYIVLAALFSQIFKEIDVETYFTKISMKFFIAGIQITFEDAMEKCIEYIEKQREETKQKTESDKEEKQHEEVKQKTEIDKEKKQRETVQQKTEFYNGEKQRQAGLRKKQGEDKASDKVSKGGDISYADVKDNDTEKRSGAGLWHNMKWTVGRFEFHKEKLDEKYANSHRIGNNFYMVPYKCPECGEFLYMVVFPNRKERVIDTDDGRIYITRAYTCDNCKKFYTARPGRLLKEGNVYMLDFDNDEYAARDYVQLLGKKGAKTGNCNFNMYEADYEREVSQSGKRLSEKCRKLELLTDEELERILAQMDEGFFSDYEKERFLAIIEQELEYREKMRNKKLGEFGRRSDERIQEEEAENIERAADKNIRAADENTYADIKDALQGEGKYADSGEYYEFLDMKKNDDEKKISKKDNEVENKRDSGLNLRERFKKSRTKANIISDIKETNVSEKHSGGNKTDEDISIREGDYDEYVSDRIKKETVNGSLKNGIEQKMEIEKVRDDFEPVVGKADAADIGEVIHWPSLYDVLMDNSRTAKYSEIVENIKKVKRSKGDEQKKLHCLDVLTKLCKDAAKREIEYMLSHLPENINFDRYKRTKEKLMTYTEIDIKPYIRLVDTKRDKVEFDELNKLVGSVDRQNRNELLDMMEKIKDGEYEKRNSDRFVEGLRKRVYAIDEAKLRGICPDPDNITFDDGLKALKEIEEGVFLPELKSNMMQLIDKKLTALKTEECELLVRKLKRDLDGKISDTSKLHFYDIRKMRDTESSDKESSFVKVAISTYAYATGKYEYPIIICDSSMFGSGKEGFIITPDHIFYKGLIKSGSIDVKNINSVSSGKKGLMVEHIEKGSVKLPCTLNKNDEKNMAEVLETFIDYLKIKPESRSVEYMSKQEHRVKCCYRCGHVFTDGNICPKCGSRFDG